MRSLTVVPDLETLAARCAEVVAELIVQTSPTRLVLAGGTTPMRAYRRLAQMGLPWGRATVLFGDERCVPAWDPASNFRMATETLLSQVHPAAVLRIPAELGPDVAARFYEPWVASAPLDLVLLGVGPDGHTASLFPGNEALSATTHVVGVRNAPNPLAERVTLTFRALESARRVVILAAGADKAEALRAAWSRGVPAGMIEKAEWFATPDAIG